MEKLLKGLEIENCDTIKELSRKLVNESLTESYINEKIKILNKSECVDTFIQYLTYYIECYNRQRTKTSEDFSRVNANVELLLNSIDDNRIKVSANTVLKILFNLAHHINKESNHLDNMLTREYRIYSNTKISSLEEKFDKIREKNITDLALFTAVISIIIASISMGNSLFNIMLQQPITCGNILSIAIFCGTICFLVHSMTKFIKKQ